MRKPRIHYPGGMYHVIQRGNNKQIIFECDDDRQKFYCLLQEALSQYACKIHSFCLMSNHIHLAVQVGEIPLSKFMHSLSFRYGKWFNWRYQRVGHLFQARYKAILVEKDSYLLELIRYIHLNPVRANIVKKAEDYLWSSHRTYLGLENLDWVTTQDVLEIFASDFRSAHNYYQKFVDASSEADNKKIFSSENLKDNEILGTDNFKRKLSVYTLSDISEWVSKKYNIKSSRLQETTRNYGYNQLRALVAWLAQTLQVCNLSTTAKYFNRDLTNINKIISQTIKNPELKNEWEILKEEFLAQWQKITPGTILG